MIIGLYDTSIVYDIIRIFGNVELPSGSQVIEVLNEKGGAYGRTIIGNNK